MCGWRNTSAAAIIESAAVGHEAARVDVDLGDVGASSVLGGTVKTR
jgi:hypothetical protein